MSFIPQTNMPSDIQQQGMNSEDKEIKLEQRIQDLEQQNANLEEDLKMTVIRQRESGASTNEVLRQLESEISLYFRFLNM